MKDVGQFYLVLVSHLGRYSYTFLKFLQGHEDKFSVYVHASKEKPVHTSRFFLDREIRSEKVCTLFKVPIHLYTVYF